MNRAAEQDQQVAGKRFSTARNGNRLVENASDAGLKTGHYSRVTEFLSILLEGAEEFVEFIRGVEVGFQLA